MKIADELKTKPAYVQGHLFLEQLYSRGNLKEKALENLVRGEAMFEEMGMDYLLGATRKVFPGL